MITRVLSATLLCIVLLSPVLNAQHSKPASALSPRNANYVIDVTLDTESHMLKATEQLIWRNTSADRITELQFHLYYNAFRNTESTMMREAGSPRIAKLAPDNWGWIEVTSMRSPEGEELVSQMEFIHPDDDNEQDRTVFRLPLKNPLLPGATISLLLTFESKIPAFAERTGYYQDYYFIAQWFPKIGVYETAGQRGIPKSGWNCHQYHATGEFYADFGVYTVNINVPKEYVVGATGVLSEVKDHGDGRKTVTHHAEDVHDFAWTASPRFLDIQDTWRNVAIRILMQPQREHQVERYRSALKSTLEYFDTHVGPYPYPVITVVDPAYGGSESGGMEYPTLITAGSFWGIGTGVKFPELVTEHEFGHQYWYGMVANNEFEEAWLDEGINSYYELRAMSTIYGENTSLVDLPGFRIGAMDNTRTSYIRMSNPKIAPIATPSWKFTVGGYGSLVYHKAALMLMTLDRMIGRTAMDSVMRTFFHRWKFRHPGSGDFIAVVNEIVPKLHGNRFGKTMDWFFDQLLTGTEVCDYAIRLLLNNVVQGKRGVYGKGSERQMLSGTETKEEAILYESWVVVSRLGEVKMPVEILFRFDSGKEIREQWDGKARFKEFRFTGTEQLVYAVVDPDKVLAVELNTLNNSFTTTPVTAPAWKYASKFLFWLQNLLHLVTIIG